MKENIRIEISETNRGKKQIIINRKYEFNFSNKKKKKKIIQRYIDALNMDIGLICPKFNSIKRYYFSFFL